VTTWQIYREERERRKGAGSEVILKEERIGHMAWNDENDSWIHQHHRQPKPPKVYKDGDGDFYAVLVVLVAVVIGIFYLIDKAVIM